MVILFLAANYLGVFFGHGCSLPGQAYAGPLFKFLARNYKRFVQLLNRLADAVVGVDDDRVPIVVEDSIHPF